MPALLLWYAVPNHRRVFLKTAVNTCALCVANCTDFLKGTELVNISTATQNGGANAMKLFEKEEANQYSEVLLPIQVRSPIIPPSVHIQLLAPIC